MPEEYSSANFHLMVAYTKAATTLPMGVLKRNAASYSRYALFNRYTEYKDVSVPALIGFK